MNQNFLGFFVAIAIAVVLATAGCAKKQKPDYDLPNTLSKNVQDKDMTFEPSGSDSGKIEGLYTVRFDYDKSNLKEDARSLLVKDSDWLKQHSNKSVQIEGHCDRHGSTEYNLGLGQKRADVVKRYLINLGISKARISTISYGKEQLLDTAETDEADMKNRRANFKPLDIPKINHMTNL